MRILIIGATGTIGQAVVRALSSHDLVLASHKKAPEHVDISEPGSINALFSRVGTVDAIISVAGQARFMPFDQLTDDDFAFSVSNKLMGQVNVARFGMEFVSDGGSITLTSGILAQQPMAGSGAISLVNAGLEGFTRAAALEAPRGVRVNVVSPPWVSETLTAMGMDPSGGLSAAVVARSYLSSVSGSQTGAVIVPGGE